MESRLETRRKDFKKTIDDPRRQREDTMAQIRRQDMTQHLVKKRQQWIAEGELNMKDDKASVKTTAPPTTEDLGAATNMVITGDFDTKLVAIQQFRRWLSMERSPPIQDVINSGVLPHFVKFLSMDSRSDLQFEAAWCLTNIASGNSQQTNTVIEAGVIPIFVQLMRSDTLEVREQATWALGNIAGDCVAARNMVLDSNVMEPLLEIFSQKKVLLDEMKKPGLIRNGVWLLSNLCRSKPEPAYEQIREALPALQFMIQTSDLEVLTDCCWTLSYWTDCAQNPNRQKVNDVLESGLVVRLSDLVMHESTLVHTPALRAIGNIVTGEDYQTDMLLKLCPMLLKNLGALVGGSKRGTRKEALWTLSNITAGSSHQIQEIIDAGLIPQVMNVLNHTREFEVKREAAWAICNAITGGNQNQVDYVVSAGAIPVLVDLLDKEDSKLVLCSVEAIKCLLQCGVRKMRDQYNDVNVYGQMVEQCGGVAKLESLQYSQNNAKLFGLVAEVLNVHFDKEIDVDMDTDGVTDMHFGKVPNQFNFQM